MSTKKCDGQSKKLIGSVGGWCFVGNSQIIVLRCLTHVKSFRNIYRISRDSQTNKNQIKCKKTQDDNCLNQWQTCRVFFLWFSFSVGQLFGMSCWRFLTYRQGKTIKRTRLTDDGPNECNDNINVYRTPTEKHQNNQTENKKKHTKNKKKNCLEWFRQWRFKEHSTAHINVQTIDKERRNSQVRIEFDLFSI